MRQWTMLGLRFPDMRRAQAFVMLACSVLACTPIENPATSADAAASAPSGQDSGMKRSADAGVLDARVVDPITHAPMRVAVGSGCSDESKHACAAGDVRGLLSCTAGSWQLQSQCKQDEQCTMPEGADATCITVAPECLGRAVGKRYCSGDDIRVCGDPAEKAAERCPIDRRCQPTEDDESVECKCGGGSIEHNGVCGPPTDCDTENGGCDTQTTCAAAASGRPLCSECPVGHVGSGETGCLPLLSSLKVMGGTLTAAFSPDVYSYQVQLAALAANVVVSALGPSGSHIELNGIRVENGQAWSTTIVPPDVMNIVIVVVSRSGYSSRYQLTVGRSEREDLYLKAEQPDQDDEYGNGVALYNDTLVIGAPKEDSNGTDSDNSVSDSGAAYVYRRVDGALKLEGYLKASTPTRSDNFGAAVAIWENTIAVGTPRQNPLGTTIPGASGVVEIFVREGSVWTRQIRLESPSPDVDLFGYAVALHKDRLVVGAPWDRATGSRCGALYVYDRKDGAWGSPSKLTAMSPKANDGLGWSVAVDSDTVIGGAIERDTMSVDTGAAGSAHVFVKGQRGFGAPQQLVAPTPMAGASFGWTVTLRGNTAVVGAPRADLVQNTPAGEAFVFERTAVDAPFAYTMRLQADIPRRADYFGSAVALDGNVLAIGASGDASGGTGPSADPSNGDVDGAGAVYLFVKVDSMWLRAGYLKSPAADVRDYMGDHVAVSGSMVVSTSVEESSSSRGIGGDPNNNDSARSGAAYVFN